LHGKNPWKIFQKNRRNCRISAIKKKDKINNFQFTFQGSKNTANKKITGQNILSKKAAKLKKNISDRIQSYWTRQFIQIFISRFFLKKVYKSKKTTRQNILSKFSSKIIEIFWKKIKWINNYHLFSDCFFQNQKKIRN
jgi:hypothetical protein